MTNFSGITNTLFSIIRAVSCANVYLSFADLNHDEKLPIFEISSRETKLI